MSALLISVVGWSANEAVEWVRDNHCKEAVETPEQCEYLCVLDIEYNDRKILENEAPMPALYISWDDSDEPTAEQKFNDDSEQEEDSEDEEEESD
jgi:hypothetical protein